MNPEIKNSHDLYSMLDSYFVAVWCCNLNRQSASQCCDACSMLPCPPTEGQCYPVEGQCPPEEEQCPQWKYRAPSWSPNIKGQSTVFNLMAHTLCSSCDFQEVELHLLCNRALFWKKLLCLHQDGWTVRKFITESMTGLGQMWVFVKHLSK